MTKGNARGRALLDWMHAHWKYVQVDCKGGNLVRVAGLSAVLQLTILKCCNALVFLCIRL